MYCKVTPNKVKILLYYAHTSKIGLIYSGGTNSILRASIANLRNSAAPIYLFFNEKYGEGEQIDFKTLLKIKKCIVK